MRRCQIHITAAVSHHAIPTIGASRISRNVTVVPRKTTVNGSTVKTMATTRVDVRAFNS